MESFRILMRPFAMFSTLALMANILKRSASVDFSSMNIRVLAFGLILQTVRIVKRRRRSWKMDSFAIKIKTKTIKLVKLLLILTTLIQPIVKRWVELQNWAPSWALNYFSKYNDETFHQFYVCLNGIEPRELQCEAGEVFSEDTKKCDDPATVPGCEDWFDAPVEE